MATIVNTLVKAILFSLAYVFLKDPREGLLVTIAIFAGIFDYLDKPLPLFYGFIVIWFIQIILIALHSSSNKKFSYVDKFDDDIESSTINPVHTLDNVNNLPFYDEHLDGYSLD